MRFFIIKAVEPVVYGGESSRPIAVLIIVFLNLVGVDQLVFG